MWVYKQQTLISSRTFGNVVPYLTKVKSKVFFIDINLIVYKVVLSINSITVKRCPRVQLIPKSINNHFKQYKFACR